MLFHHWFCLHFFNYQCSQTSFHMVIICLYLFFSEQTVHILVYFFFPTGPEINFKVFCEIKSRIHISNILLLPLILFPFVLRWQIAGRAGGLGIFTLCCLSGEPSVTSQKGLSVPPPSRTRQLIIQHSSGSEGELYQSNRALAAAKYHALQHRSAVGLRAVHLDEAFASCLS